MEVLHPSEIDLAVPVSQVAVIDMVDPSFAALKHHYNGHLQFENNRNNDVVLEETKRQIKKNLHSEGFFYGTDVSFPNIPKTGSFKLDSVVEEQLDEVCSETPFDALVSIEAMKASYDNYRFLEGSISKVGLLHFYADDEIIDQKETVFLEMVVAVYTCQAGKSVRKKSTPLAAQVNYSKSGITLAESHPPFRFPKELLIEASHKIAGKYVPSLIPQRVKETRDIFVSGDEQFRHAFNLAGFDQWQEAADIWILLATSNNKKVASRATFNLIVAHEMIGNFSEAQKFLQLCIDKYNLPLAKKYASVLEKRIKYTQNINERFPSRDIR